MKIRSEAVRHFFTNSGRLHKHMTYCLQLFQHELWRNRFIRLDDHRFGFNVSLNIGHTYKKKRKVSSERIMLKWLVQQSC